MVWWRAERSMLDRTFVIHCIFPMLEGDFYFCCSQAASAENKIHPVFLIPIINHPEKHNVTATSLLSREQKYLTAQLGDWAQRFVTPQRNLQ